MKVVYSAPLSTEQEKIVYSISKECGIMQDTARILVCRGIDSVDKAVRFLNPGKHNFNDPFLLDGMVDAVERLKIALKNQEKVLIFGDYDADGICATTVLYNVLKDFGLNNVLFVTPEREEGYGLSVEKIKTFNLDGKLSLVVSVDCGISDFDKVEELKKLGIDVIITDHHEPPEILPDCIKINPKIKNQAYPFKELCGAGVAYKLGYALIGDLANEYLDYVSLATIADSMELLYENRDIVTEGLKIFNSQNIKKAFKYLLLDNTKTITAQTIAYILSPRVNAGGRMGDSACALKLLTTTSEREMVETAEKLNQYNLLRQVVCDEIYSQAKEQIDKEKLDLDKIILVKNEEWKTGVVGIVASRLVEEYCRPVIVFAGHGEDLKGSARSVEGINIFNALTSVSDILSAFGGHAQAAGVTVLKENFDLLRKRLNEEIEKISESVETEKKIFADLECKNKLTIKFAKEIDRLEPFGIGNKKPLFAVRETLVYPESLKHGSPHFKFDTSVIEMLNFNGEKDNEILKTPIKKTLVFETNVSTYKGQDSLKGFLRYVAPDYSDLKDIKWLVLENELLKLKNDSYNVELSALPKNALSGKTAYVLTDVDNVDLISFNKKLPRSLFTADNSVQGDMVLISPRLIPACVNNVVYLDKPLSIFNTDAKLYFLSDKIGYKFIEKLSIDRRDFVGGYNYLSTLVGKKYLSPSEIIEIYHPEIDREQFVFSTLVFFELGIFYQEEGVIKRENSIMRPLDNSVIFTAVKSIKEKSL